MEAALSEMPLALFSTVAPMGAGSFAALAALFLAASLTDDQRRALDRLTALPVALVAVGFAAATLHLASPGRAVGVLAGVGSSPLSNEVAAGIVFGVLMVAYWAWALSGRMAEGARVALVTATAALGIVFALFIGMAYLVSTIPSWDTLATPVSVAGFALLGGAAVGTFMAGVGGCAPALAARAPRLALGVLAAAGLVLGLGGAAAQLTGAAALASPLASGAEQVASVAGAVVVGVVCSVAAAVATVVAASGRRTTWVGGGAVVLAFVGILALRLAFYATELSVGLA